MKRMFANLIPSMYPTLLISIPATMAQKAWRKRILTKQCPPMAQKDSKKKKKKKKENQEMYKTYSDQAWRKRTQMSANQVSNDRFRKAKKDVRRDVLTHKEEEKKQRGGEGESWEGRVGEEGRVAWNMTACLVCEGFSVFSYPRVLNKPPNVRNVFFFFKNKKN